MLRNLVRRLILWAVPEAGGYAEGGEVRPFQENQDTTTVAVPYVPNDPGFQEWCREVNRQGNLLKNGRFYHPK